MAGASQAAASDTGWYAFGVVRSRDAEPLPAEGIEADRPPRAVTEGNLAAIVSEVDLHQFAEDRLSDNLRDPEWLSTRVQAHEAVLEALIRDRTVLPMRFGTIFRDLEGVRGLLSRGEEQLSGALATLAGSKEWGVRASLDRGRMDQWLRERRPQPSSTPGGAEGAAYLGERRAQRDLDREIEQVTQAAERRAEDALRSVARAVRRRGSSGRSESSWAVDLAVLVPEERLGELQWVVDELAKSLEPRGLGFEMTGPWPPYSFVNIELSQEAAS
jgi:hypothetical protein